MKQKAYYIAVISVITSILLLLTDCGPVQQQPGTITHHKQAASMHIINKQINNKQLSLTMNRRELQHLTDQLVNTVLDSITLNQPDFHVLSFTNVTRKLYNNNNNTLATMLVTDGTDPTVQTGTNTAVITYKGVILRDQPYMGSDRYPEHVDSTLQYYISAYQNNNISPKPNSKRVIITITKQNSVYSTNITLERL